VIGLKESLHLREPFLMERVSTSTLMGIKPGVTLPFCLAEEIADRTSASVTVMCGWATSDSPIELLDFFLEPVSWASVD